MQMNCLQFARKSTKKGEFVHALHAPKATAVNCSALHGVGAKLGQTETKMSQDEVMGWAALCSKASPGGNGQADVFRPLIFTSPQSWTLRHVIDTGPWGWSPWTVVAVHHPGCPYTDLQGFLVAKCCWKLLQDTHSISGLEALFHSHCVREK